MFTILGADGKEYGPVTAGKIAECITGGRANLQTKARRADETEWKTLGDYPEFGLRPSSGSDEQPTLPPPVTGGVGAEAPAAASRLQGSPAEISARLAPQAAAFDLFACLSRSFTLWKDNF